MKGNEKIKEKKAQWLKVALITAKKKSHIEALGEKTIQPTLNGSML